MEIYYYYILPAKSGFPRSSESGTPGPANEGDGTPKRGTI